MFICLNVQGVYVLVCSAPSLEGEGPKKSRALAEAPVLFLNGFGRVKEKEVETRRVCWSGCSTRLCAVATAAQHPREQARSAHPVSIAPKGIR